eukprot:Sspe_Gene.26324::Locus_10851_Transcript_2_2_Confidence_0.667_Length_932::g.26324::m.26324/K11092/SNRPA1; U2 small nuclear ribonucleoprotein A'
MVRLSVDLLAKCPKYTNPLKEKEVEIRGHKIPEIENLGVLEDAFDSIDLSDNEIKRLCNFPILKRCTTLILHNNHINSFGPNLGTSLPSLRNLMLQNNQFRELSDLSNLSGLPNLERISLVDNVVTKHPDYRLFVIAQLPNLKQLDFCKVKPAEREAAVKKFGKPMAQVHTAEDMEMADMEEAAPAAPVKMTDEEKAEIVAAIENATLDNIKDLESRLPPPPQCINH